MSDFTASASTGGQLDARKRVNYALGLVLGEDEFRQEQYYLRERDHRAVRALHGYGTLAGLAVAIDGERVIVRPGLAVDAVGRFMCVPSDQCASLGDWLTSHHDAVLDRITGSPGLPGKVPLYVVLCYRECETDKVPLPSEPCQSDEESMAASRIADGFELRLELDPPAPTNELEGGLIAAAVDELVHLAEGPLTGSPPEEPGDLDDVRGRILEWILRRRPELAKRPCLAPGDPPCVLLARLDVDVDLGDEGALALGDPATVDDADRPLLLSTRFLQEWLMALTAIERDEVRVLDDLDDVDTGGLSQGDVLALDGGQWVPKAPITDHDQLAGLADDDHLQYLPADGSRPLTGDLDAGSKQLKQLADATDGQDAVTLTQLKAIPAGVDDHGALTGLGDDDHPQYVPANGSRPLTGNLDAGSKRLTKLANATAAQDAVTLTQIANVMRNGDGAGGDLGDTYPNPTVVGLQTRHVSEEVPTDGFALVWDEAARSWVPRQISGGGVAQRVLPFATITFSDLIYEIWLNIEAAENPISVKDLSAENLRIAVETETDPFLADIKYDVADHPLRNVFVIRIDPDVLGQVKAQGLLRFIFTPEAMSLIEIDASLAAYAEKNGIAYEGAGPKGTTVTCFVRDRTIGTG